MGLKYSKTIKVGPVNINLSKSGVGVSIGNELGRIAKTAKGTTRTTIKTPIPGLSYVTETKKKKSK